MRHEVDLVRETVHHSALRELVEVRVRSEPGLVAALRRLDRAHGVDLLPFTPVHRDRPLLALTRESLGRIEVTSWFETLTERYRPPPSARVLVLLPCSARKPYSLSRSHRRMAEAMSGVANRAAVLEVVLTSPLGAVPRELERTYPAAQYDIPVSGEWYSEEVERMRLLLQVIRDRGEFATVVSHMGHGLPFLDEDSSVVRTREEGEGTLDREALRRLAKATAEGASSVPRVQWRERSAEDVASLARFQFGIEAAEALMRDARVEGRHPGHKVRGSDGVQRASVVPARGRLSLTLAGAEVVAATGHNRVWMDDFELRGDLFAVGVTDVDPGLRPAEEAVVLRGETVTGVGVARMCGIEMLASSRGVAVATRHKRSGGGGG
jgi:archaeosine synthase